MLRRRFLCILGMSCAGVVDAASLWGSRGSLEKQNEVADRADLTRIADDAELEHFKKVGLLVKIPEGLGIKIDSRLSEKFRFVRPWTATFLTELGQDFYKEFKSEFQINSAVRTVVYQGELRTKYKNGNAAPATGDRRSSHPTGATVDIGKLTLSGREIRWLRKVLLQAEKEGRIEATEEYFKAVFHFMVFPPEKMKKRKRPS